MLPIGPMPFRMVGMAVGCLMALAAPLYWDGFLWIGLRIDPMLYGSVVFLIAANYPPRRWCVSTWIGYPMALMLMVSLVTIQYTNWTALRLCSGARRWRLTVRCWSGSQLKSRT
jgi:hypothetical protein